MKNWKKYGIASQLLGDKDAKVDFKGIHEHTLFRFSHERT